MLSCRSADWRSATGLQGPSDAQELTPLELHREPLERAEAQEFLAYRLDGATAERVLGHLEERGLAGLWSNPQTLELVAEVGRVRAASPARASSSPTRPSS